MLVIGDIHGRHLPLSKILKEIWDGQELIVLLGDFNDGKAENCSWLLVWDIIKPLLSQGKAVAVQSNHVERLVGHLRGQSRGDKGSFGETVRELEQCTPQTLKEMKKCLRDLPPMIRIKEGEKTWVFAHAFPTSQMATAINGPVEKGCRIAWWDQLETTSATHIAVGHYGKSLQRVLLDGSVTVVDCEKELSAVAWFRTTTNQLSITHV